MSEKEIALIILGTALGFFAVYGMFLLIWINKKFKQWNISVVSDGE